MVRLTAALAFASLIVACTPVSEVASESVAVTPASLDGQMLFVANKRGNSVMKIDLASGQEVKRVESCKNPHELATSPDGKFVALACYGGTSVDIFSTTDLSKVGSVDLGENARPHGIVWLANGRIYVTAEGQSAIYQIINPLPDQGHRIPVIYTLKSETGKSGSHMIAVSPDGNLAWTTDLGSKTVTLINGSAIEPRSVVVGVEPEGIALSPDGKSLWVSARGSDKTFELDPVTLEVRREVETGRFPLRIVIRPQGDVAVTSNLADGSLSVIDLATAKVTRTIAVSSAAEAQERAQVTILWSDDGERIYVAETGTDTVAEVHYASGKVLRRLKTGDGGDGLAILSGTSDD